MKLTLINVKDEAPGTKSFFWKPERHINFLPGQYFYYTLPRLNYPDSRGPTRHFTISSSPTEPESLRLITRIRKESGYKKSLAELLPGTEIEGEGPQGTFVLDDNVLGAQVFLAGGIGITPFRSIIKYAVDRKLNIPIRLIYSNSDSRFIFKSELVNWSKKIDIKTSFVDTSKTGRLDRKEIAEVIGNWKLKIENCSFWVVGPPAFTNSLEKIIESLKVPPDKIKSEKFTGY